MAASSTDMALIFSLEEDQKKELIDMCITGELQGYIKLRQQRGKATQKIPEDVPPGSEPVLEYIEDLERRQRIFEELHHLQVQNSDYARLNMVVFGVVMIAPIPYLEACLDQIRQFDRMGDQKFVLMGFVGMFLYRCEGTYACLSFFHIILLFLSRMFVFANCCLPHIQTRIEKYGSHHIRLLSILAPNLRQERALQEIVEMSSLLSWLVFRKGKTIQCPSSIIQHSSYCY